MSYLGVILLLALAIVLHELGHFLAARAVGLPVSVFSVGFGRKLWSFRWGQTEYQLALLPLGGYVLLDLEEEQLRELPLRHRLLYLFAGPAANLLCVLGLFGIINCLTDGFTLHALLIQPWSQTAVAMGNFLTMVPKLLSQPDKLSGVIGIVAHGNNAMALGIVPLLQFLLMMNLNLGILNLLPIPPLDGGKITLSVLERLHPRSAALVEAPLTYSGVFLLLGLMAYVTLHDLYRLGTQAFS